MEIIVAKTAGFCFGVNRAVSTAYNLLDAGEGRIYTFGQIIHNDDVVASLQKKGAAVIDEAGLEVEPGHVVIRAHGVSPEVYSLLEEREFKISDATCPYVKKIHKLVSEKYAEGFKIIIIGDRNHPEVKGINGWCNNTACIVNGEEEALELPDSDDRICVVAQTTMISEKWDRICALLENKYRRLEKHDTICRATSARQQEAADIAAKVDLMLVIGSKSSSNTQKLYELCSKRCPLTFNIETCGDLPLVDIKKIKKIGITAGASTPDRIIKEVIEKMEDINRQENEVSFKEAFENSLVSLQTGEIVKGKIIGFNNAEVYVDMGYKSDGIIPIEEFTDDPDFDPEKSLKIGEEIEVFIIRVNDGEGNVLLSKKKVDSIRNIDKLEEAYANKTPVRVKVLEAVSGGLVATSGGVRIFIPASQVGERFVKDLGEYVKQTINVRIIEYNKQKKKFVGSQRALLLEERSRLEAEFWSGIEAGKRYTGTVKSVTDFGIFVDIGGVDGLVHISELSWGKVKHPSEVAKEGDMLEVTVLEFDREKKRISLGYRKPEDNPWFKATEKYKEGDVVKGKVVRLVPFGAFVELEEGIDGLVHISQISNSRIARPGDVLEIGQQIEAKLIEVNIEAKKISLSIKELLPADEQPAAKEEGAGDGEEETPSEHREEMKVTLGDVLEGMNGTDANE